MTDVQRFYGTAEQLMSVVALTGIPGEWEQLLNGHYLFRAETGAVLNWWSTTKKVFFQGNSNAARELEEALLRISDAHCDDLSTPSGTSLAIIRSEN